MISLIFNIFSLCFFIWVVSRIYNAKIAIVTLFLLSSSILLFELLFRLWNPSFGFGFMITSYSFVLLNIIRIRKLHIILFTLFGLISFQFHSTYILPIICGYFYIFIYSKNKFKDFLTIISSFVLIFIFLFSHSIYYFNKKNIEKFDFGVDNLDSEILHEEKITILSDIHNKNK